MLRRLFTILAALSLLLCLAVIAHRVFCSPMHIHGPTVFFTHDSAITFGTGERSYGKGMPGLVSNAQMHEFVGGLACITWREPGQAALRWTVRIPDKLTIEVTLILPAAWAASRALTWRRQKKRRALGLCLTCGYDLRASKDRCPECGAPIQGSPPQDPALTIC